MELILKRNSHGNIIRFVLVKEGGYAEAKLGLNAHSDGLHIVYLRDNDANPIPVTLFPWKVDVSLPGGFREVDAELMPGLYELVLPDELCAEGAQRATLMILAPDVKPQVIHINLVGYDPYDQYRLGLDCLSREERHEVISRAFREVLPEVVQAYLQRAIPAPN
jgi:hypothetical protein